MVCVPFLLATVYVGTLGEWLDYGAPCTSDVVAAREGYVVGFNDQTHCPDWTMHRVSAANLRGPKTKRTDDFRHDPQVPRSAELDDYKGSGWSRGHMVPAARNCAVCSRHPLRCIWPSRRWTLRTGPMTDT